jgi:hypothetical protein
MIVFWFVFAAVVAFGPQCLRRVWVPKTSVPLCDLAVFVDQVSEETSALYLAICAIGLPVSRTSRTAPALKS